MCICDKNSDIFNFSLTFAYMEKEFVTMNRREWLKRSAAGLTALAVAGAVGGFMFAPLNWLYRGLAT